MSAEARPAHVCADEYAASVLARSLPSRHAQVLDRRLESHVDPEVAAVLLTEQLGGRAAAFRWATALLAEVGAR